MNARARRIVLGLLLALTGIGVLIAAHDVAAKASGVDAARADRRPTPTPFPTIPPPTPRPTPTPTHTPPPTPTSTATPRPSPTPRPTPTPVPTPTPQPSPTPTVLPTPTPQTPPLVGPGAPSGDPQANAPTATGSAEAVELTGTLVPASVDAGATSDSNALFVLTMLLFVAIPLSIVMALVATVLIRR